MTPELSPRVSYRRILAQCLFFFVAIDMSLAALLMLTRAMSPSFASVRGLVYLAGGVAGLLGLQYNWRWTRSLAIAAGILAAGEFVLRLPEPFVGELPGVPNIGWGSFLAGNSVTLALALGAWLLWRFEREQRPTVTVRSNID
jgi:hypothetical protein